MAVPPMMTEPGFPSIAPPKIAKITKAKDYLLWKGSVDDYMMITGLDKYYDPAKKDPAIAADEARNDIWKRWSASLRVAIEASIHPEIMSMMMATGYTKESPTSCIKFCEEVVCVTSGICGSRDLLLFAYYLW
jgi:hypothetical protein